VINAVETDSDTIGMGDDGIELLDKTGESYPEGNGLGGKVRCHALDRFTGRGYCRGSHGIIIDQAQYDPDDALPSFRSSRNSHSLTLILLETVRSELQRCAVLPNRPLDGLIEPLSIIGFDLNRDPN